MVAEGCTIAREEPTSCNHDNYGCCKVPSAAFHLDLDIHDLLPQEEQSQCDCDVSEPSGVGMSNCGYKDSSLTRMTAHSHMGKGASMAPL